MNILWVMTEIIFVCSHKNEKRVLWVDTWQWTIAVNWEWFLEKSFEILWTIYYLLLFCGNFCTIIFKKSFINFYVRNICSSLTNILECSIYNIFVFFHEKGIKKRSCCGFHAVISRHLRYKSTIFHHKLVHWTVVNRNVWMLI